jgi:CPA2 family monovalent cation:H+ antiporter-2
VLALTLLPVLFKFGLVTALAQLFGAPPAWRCAPACTSRRPASSASCAALATDLAAHPARTQGPVLASMVLSMLATPFIVMYSNRIVMRLSLEDWLMQSVAMTSIAKARDQHRDARDHRGLTAAAGRTWRASSSASASRTWRWTSTPDRVRQASRPPARASSSATPRGCRA